MAFAFFEALRTRYPDLDLYRFLRLSHAQRTLPYGDFLVKAEARLAPVATRSDWSAAISPSLAIDASTRARLAAAWTVIGQMEHASIAAFARFALQLMCVGAPATYRA